MTTKWVSVGWLLFEGAWKKMYHPEDSISKWAIAMDASGWWWLAKRQHAKIAEDMGPFSSFGAAAACYTTLD